VQERALGLSILLRASVWRPSPKIRVSTVCPEAGREATSSGFEPAKALVRGLPLPRPPSFRAHLGCLPVGQVPTAGTTHGATSDRLVAGGEDTSGEGGGLLAWLCAPTGDTWQCVRQTPFGGLAALVGSMCSPRRDPIAVGPFCYPEDTLKRRRVKNASAQAISGVGLPKLTVFASSWRSEI
jgi:hypothetical protein